MKKRKLLQVSLLGSLVTGFLVTPITVLADVVTTSNTEEIKNIETVDSAETLTSISNEKEVISLESVEEASSSTIESTVETTEKMDSVIESSEKETKDVKEQKVNLEYSAHIQTIGWQDFVKDGEMAGTVGKILL